MTSYKILNINQVTTITGGSDVYWYNLSKLLEEKGHKVTNFGSRFPNQREYPEIIDKKVEKYLPTSPSFENPRFRDIIKFIYSIEAKNKIKKILDADSYDLAHLHIYYGRLTSSIIQEIHKRNIPIVQTSHDYKLVCPSYLLLRNNNKCNLCTKRHYYHCIINKCNKNRFWRSLLSTIEAYISNHITTPKINRIIAVSEYQKKILVEMGVNANKITTINNFVHFHKPVKRQNMHKYFIFVGRLEKYKGIYTLLSALDFLKLQGLEIPVIIIGDGPERRKMKKYVHQNNLSSVNIIGSVDHSVVTSYLSDAIALVAPSYFHETFGLTVAEAQAAGIAVIASKVGAYTELVQHEGNGFLFPPDDFRELASKMRYLFENPMIAKRMGLKGYHSAKENYSKDAHYDKLIDLYNTVLHDCAN